MLSFDDVVVVGEANSVFTENNVHILASVSHCMNVSLEFMVMIYINVNLEFMTIYVYM